LLDFFSLSAGDACSAFGLAFIPQYSMKNYSTKLPPIIKYINFDEIWAVYANWFAEVIYKATNVIANPQDALNYLAAPIPINYAQIAVRQSILKYLASSQAATQFQAYTTDGSTYWEAFRVGSNTVPRPAQPLNFPLLLAENIRALEPKVYNYGRQAGIAERLSQVYVPCIGMFPDNDLVNPLIDVNGEIFSVFGPPLVSESGISLIDGTGPSSTVFDFNSSCIKFAIAAINELLGKLQQVSGPWGPLEGSSDFNLLAFTRYDQIGSNDFEKTMATTPQWGHTVAYKNRLADYNRKKRDFEGRVKLARSPSRGKTDKEEKFVYTVHQGIDSYVARYYSGGVPITNDIKNVLANLVVPSLLILETGGASQINLNMGMTAFCEKHFYTVGQDSGFGNIGGATIGEVCAYIGIQQAPGTAANPEGEVSRVMEFLQKVGKGGFLDALLQGVMTFAQNL